MKKYRAIPFSILILFSALFIFNSCEQDEDTPVDEPAGTFFSATINGHNKSITPGNNGYLSVNSDTCYTDLIGDHFNSYIQFYQAPSGYYISSREVIEISLINLLDSTLLNKDSLFHARLSMTDLPVFTYYAQDSSLATGIQIKWRNSDGVWYSTAGGAQNGGVYIDTTMNTTQVGGFSSRELYLRFDCTLYEIDGDATLNLTSGRARIYLYNTCFY
ncbi:MAG: hypothetical protein C0592_13785 [Marinilabiliales bacterium]|nr:MAG: hypothetical protein C0592_13785 [Marinilabiliales bacterium]